MLPIEKLTRVTMKDWYEQFKEAVKYLFPNKKDKEENKDERK